MAHFLKFWCLFLLFSLSLLGAGSPSDVDRYLLEHAAVDKYLLYVTDVDPESYRFVVSNNMAFHIAKKYWRTDPLPEVGDEVQFCTLFNAIDKDLDKELVGQFACQFSYTDRLRRIWMPKESKKYCLSYVATQSVCIQPDGWVFSGMYRDVFELSDGSKWMADKEGKFPFKKGNRILLTKVYNRWVIINIDQTDWMKDSKGKSYMYYPEVSVTPYYIPEKVADE